MRSKHKTILTVDDTPANIRLLTHYLEKQGYKVITAEDGFEGFKAAIQYQPDLVLLDIMMPGTDGYEVCELLKAEEETKDIPVVFLTAKADVEDKVRGYELGAVDYITKPFNLVEIATRVQTQLDLRDLQDQCQRYSQSFITLQSLVNKGQVGNRIVHQFDQKLHAINGRLNKIQKELNQDSAEYKSLDSIQKNLSDLTNTSRKWIKLIEPKISEMPSFYLDQPIDDAIEMVQSSSYSMLEIDFVKSEEVPKITGEYGLLKQAFISLLTSCQSMADTTSWVGIRIDNECQPPKSVKKTESGIQYVKVDFSSDVKVKYSDDKNSYEIDFLFEASNLNNELRLTAAFDIFKIHGGIVDIEKTETTPFHVSVYLPEH